MQVYQGKGHASELREEDERVSSESERRGPGKRRGEEEMRKRGDARSSVGRLRQASSEVNVGHTTMKFRYFLGLHSTPRRRKIVFKGTIGRQIGGGAGEGP